MLAETFLTLLLVSCVCAVGMGIVASEFTENVKAKEATFMKYGLCAQIWTFLMLCGLRVFYPNSDLLMILTPLLALMGAGLFMLGVCSVVKAMPKGKSAFAVLAVGIQGCVVTFFSISTTLIP